MNTTIRKIQFILISSMLLTMFLACSNQWDDHVAIYTPSLNKSVIEAIESQPDLSVFYGMLQATGYDNLLASENEFTVLAPNNSALDAYK